MGEYCCTDQTLNEADLFTLIPLNNTVYTIYLADYCKKSNMTNSKV